MSSGRVSKILRTLLTGAAAMIAAATATAAPLEVDTSFGSSGRIALPVPATAVESSVDLVPISPTTYAMVTVGGTGTRLGIQVRLRNADGSVPADDVRTYPIGDLTVGPDVAATADGAGGLVIATSQSVGAERRIVVIHVRADRTLDPAFGGDGVVELPSRGASGVTALDIFRAANGSISVIEQIEDPQVREYLPTRLLASGALDATYGTNGAGARTGWNVSPSVDPIYAGGGVDATGTITVAASDSIGARAARWTATGAADPGFGTAGQATIGAFGTTVFFPADAEVDGTGRLVMAGSAFPSATANLGIVRLTTAGVPDTAFGGGDGLFTTAPPSGSWRGQVLDLLSTGEIVCGSTGRVGATDDRNVRTMVSASGTSAITATDSTTPILGNSASTLVGSRFVRVQLFQNEERHFSAAFTTGPPSSFSGGNTVLGRTLDLGEAPSYDSLKMIAGPGDVLSTVPFLSFAPLTNLQPTSVTVGPQNVTPLSDQALAIPAGFGDMVEVIRARNGGLIAVSQTKLVRITPGGSLDTTFDGDGVATLPAFGLVRGLAEDADGALYVGGRNGAAQMAIARYTRSGALDPSYGTAGVAVVATESLALAVGTGPGGTLIAIGQSPHKAVRLTSGGTLDPTYGSAGKAAFPAALTAFDGAMIDRQGRAYLLSRSGNNAAIARLTTDGVADSTFGTGGTVLIAPGKAGMSASTAGLAEMADGALTFTISRFPTLGGSPQEGAGYVDQSGVPAVAWTANRLSVVSPLSDGRIAMSDGFGGAMLLMLRGLPPTSPSVKVTVLSPFSFAISATGEANGFSGVSLTTEIGPTTAYGNTAATPLEARAGAQTAARTVTGLLPGTTYHVRAVLRNASGVAESPDTTITTPSFAPPPVPAHAKLQVLRTRVRSGRLEISLKVDPRATGRVAATYVAARRTTRFTVRLTGKSSITVRRLLPAAQRRAPLGTLTLRYPGTATFRPTSVRLLTAAGDAAMRPAPPALTGRLLTVRGTISARTRGAVRVSYRHLAADRRTVKTVTTTAKIVAVKGRTSTWRARVTLSAQAAAAGGTIELLYAGDGPRRIGGQLRVQTIRGR